MNRVCKACKVDKPIEEMASAGYRNGKQYYRHYCKPCYSAAKYQDKKDKKQWFREFKKTLQCSNCGFSDHRALVFHHVDPSNKEGELANIANKGWSITRIKEEIDKCIVLCANCHSIHHYTETDV